MKHYPKVLPRITPVSSALATILGLTALIGWATNALHITRISPEFIPMAPATALCLVSLGAVLLVRRWAPAHRSLQVVLRALAGLVLIFTTALLLEFALVSVAGSFLDIEKWIVPATLAEQGYTIGRMSPLTALLLALLAAATLFSFPGNDTGRARYRAAQSTSVCVLIVGLILMIGYWYGAPLLYGGTITAVALNAVVGFILISVGLLFEDTSAFFSRWVTSTSVIAQFTRLMIPVSVLIILFADYFEATFLEQLPLVYEVSARSLIAVFITGLISVLIIMMARQVQETITRGEQAVRESEQKYRQLAENSITGIFIYQNGGYVYVNNRFAEMHGYEAKELLGMESWRLAHPDSRQLVNEMMARRLRGDAVPPYESLRLKKNGQSFWCQTVGTVIEYQGKPAILANVIDITGRKQAEEQLLKSKQLLENVTQGITNDILLLSNDYKILWANKTATEKYTDGQGRPVLGEYCYKVTHHRSRPCDSPPEAELCPLGQAREQGKPVTVIHTHLDIAGNRKVMEVTVYPVMNETGEVMQFVHISNDVTERKQAEEALNDSEMRYRLIAENSLTGIYVMQDGRLVYANKKCAEMHGYEVEEMLGMEGLQLVHPDEKDLVRERQAARLRGEPLPDTFARRHLKKDGQTLWTEMRTTDTKYMGKPARMANIIDLTKRKKAEQEMAELEHKAQVNSRLALIGEMAAGMAHEINNPLTGVTGYAQLLLSNPDLPAGMRPDLETINESAQRISSIVRKLLVFARQSKPEQKLVSINEAVTATLDLRSYSLQRSNIEVTTRLDPDLPLTISDTGQLQHVFLNVIVNAETEMKLAHGKGKLLISTEQVNNSLRISFKDNGPGISKENMEKIFTPFFTTREVGQGTGLGLSLCYGIMSNLGGRIYARSTPGKGATFIVELPLVTEDKQLELPAPVVDEKQMVTTGKILVVDDEPVNRQFLSRVLTNQGHDVETTNNGADALERIRNGKYDLVLLDIKMPGMSGIDLYEHIKKTSASLAGKVLFVTGDVLGEDTAAFFSRTGATHITKPIDTEELKKEINRMLANN